MESKVVQLEWGKCFVTVEERVAGRVEKVLAVPVVCIVSVAHVEGKVSMELAEGMVSAEFAEGKL